MKEASTAGQQWLDEEMITMEAGYELQRCGEDMSSVSE